MYFITAAMLLLANLKTSHLTMTSKKGKDCLVLIVELLLTRKVGNKFMMFEAGLSCFGGSQHCVFALERRHL